MLKKIIKIDFIDFWKGFDKENNYFIKCLKKYYNVVISENPDYIFYSVFGNKYLKYDCVRIFYTAENIVPNFNLCDFAIGFSFMQFEDRYLRFPLYWIYENDVELMLNKHCNFSYDIGKTEFCNFIYSNGKADPIRVECFKHLLEYKFVKSGGKCLNNIGSPIKNKHEFQKVFRFSIAFENASAPGYSTEKIVQAFSARTIPIYWGDPSISETFNENAFINCHNFDSIEDVVKEVIRIDQDNELVTNILNTPAMVDKTLKNKKEQELEHFLTNIFDMETNRAFKRANYGWAYSYEKKAKRFSRIWL